MLAAARLLPSLAAALLAAPVVAGCSSGGSTSSSSTQGRSATTSTSSATTSSASTTPATSGSSTGAGTAVDGKELCAFLTAELPKLKAVGSPVGAAAQFVADFFAWGEPKGLSGATQQQFDEAARTSCPSVRDQVIAVTGQTTLVG